MKIKTLIEKLQEGYSLSKDEAVFFAEGIVDGSLEPVLVSALLVLMNGRPFSVSEILGFREVLLRSAITIDLSEWNPIDVCGTGGDGKSTFNISTAAALLLAAAKVPVAKHGNHGVSSLFGSSTLMEAMGYVFSTDETKLKKEMDICSISFLHAPLFHPAMKLVAPIRKALGVRTIFNLLGPLLNPASVRSQMTGVFGLEAFHLYSSVLREISESAIVVHSVDGHDEVSLTSPCFISRLISTSTEDRSVHSYIEPGVSAYNGVTFSRIDSEALRASDTIQEAAEKMFLLLKGQADSDLEEVVVANAALAYVMKNPSVTLSSAILLLKDVLRSGAAFDNTKRLIEMQR